MVKISVFVKRGNVESWEFLETLSQSSGLSQARRGKKWSEEKKKCAANLLKNRYSSLYMCDKQLRTMTQRYQKYQIRHCGRFK